MIRTAEPAVLYARLRGGEQWHGSVVLDGLEVAPDGSVELQTVPAVVPRWTSSAGPTPASGIALDDNCGVYLSDADEHAVIRVALDCGERLRWPGQADPLTVHDPTGMCLGPLGRLFVACPNQSEVLVLTTPDLALVARWTAGLQRPTWIASSANTISVSDPASGAVNRFDARGRIDSDFQSTFALPAGATAPGPVAMDSDGVIFLACSGIPGINRYERDGRLMPDPLAMDTSTVQAIAVREHRLYIADEASGQVRIYALPDGLFVGAVAGFGGRTAAVAAGADGRVYLKVGSGDDFEVAQPHAARATTGALVAGPLDAGRDNTWYRVAVTAFEPSSTTVSLDTYLSSNRNASPGWMPAPSLDELLSDRPYRYLWLRVTLQSQDPLTTPRLVQVEAETPGDSYLKYLPAVYSRDGDSDFLERLLDLAKSVLGDLESAIEDLPRIFDPETSPAADLPWLASWLGFDVPARLADLKDPGTLRSLIGSLQSRYKRRSTPRGVSEFVEVYTGTRPHLIERFHERAVWVLGGNAALGFETGLPTTSVDGLVVDESVVGATTLAEDGWGYSLFEPTAHRFTVQVPAAAVPDHAARRLLRTVIEDQKPAHTDFHLCLAEPKLRVGLQARLGVDTIVAGPPRPTPLGSDDALDRDFYLADDPLTAPAAVERRARVGIDTRLD
jgi:phage tail-like protein